MIKPKKPTVRVSRGKVTPRKPAPVTPERYHADGRSNRIAELAIGESLSEAVRIEIGNASKDAITEARARLRNNLTRSVTNAKERSGNNFKLEVGEFITSHSNDVCVVAVVTRVDHL